MVYTRVMSRADLHFFVMRKTKLLLSEMYVDYVVESPFRVTVRLTQYIDGKTCDLFNVTYTDKGSQKQTVFIQENKLAFI